MGGWGSFVLFSVLKAIHLGVFAWLAGPLMWRAYAIPAIAALWVGSGAHAWHVRFRLARPWATPGSTCPCRCGSPHRRRLRHLVRIRHAFGSSRDRHPSLSAKTSLAAGGVGSCCTFCPRFRRHFNASQQVLTVQPNIDTEEVWTAESASAALSSTWNCISDALPARLVVWPELPAPFYYYDDPVFREEAQLIAQEARLFPVWHRCLYQTIVSRMNSAVLLGPEGNEIGRYDKVNLVPFGEFVPPLFGFVNRITQEAGDFVPGQR